MKNVVVRAISGAVYVALIIGAIFLGKEAFGALILLFILLSVPEALRLFSAQRKPDNLCRVIDIAGGLSVYMGMTAPYFFPSADISSLPVFATFIPFTIYFLVRLMVELFINGENPIANLGASLLSVIYPSLPLAMLFILYCFAGRYVVLAMFIFIWLNDTGAFCVGSLIGKHKLSVVSPKKSWEGVWGGLLFCVIAGALFGTIGSEYFTDNWVKYIIMGITAALLSTIGDLVESLFKRTAGVKDSGNIMPGHGGILDRIDSLLFVAPATLCLLFIY
ncbi:MAG: phosphatidate cytidylyltransferase [Muribaculaceae bacterium]|nr:phosphatidate cytidylyltransferase [Muribaculaceae bacterium]